MPSWQLGMQIQVRQQGNNPRIFVAAQTVYKHYSLRHCQASEMLPHFGRMIHRLHGIDQKGNQKMSLRGILRRYVSSRLPWQLPPRHQYNCVTAGRLVPCVASPGMQHQLGCHPRSPTIQVPQTKTLLHGMVWSGMEIGLKYTQHHFLHIRT